MGFHIDVGLAKWLIQVIELVFVLAVAALILIRRAPRGQEPSGFQAAKPFFTGLARKKTASVLFCGVLTLTLRAALIPVLGIPEPHWNDEFSYLLAADTFAHGRLTNPTHPMWIHFENFHIIERPTYMSMYPPAQGLVLAAGERLGHPWIGQWLITAAMCSALCWMLQAWLPARWALFGGIIASLRLGVLSYWMNSYWAASIAALGGALVLGALPRLRRSMRVRDGVLMALGLLILANSRPYEGFVYSLPVAGGMLFWLVGQGRPGLKISLLRVVLPVVLVLAVGGVATGYFYYRVTGNPFRMTYQVNRGTYATAPYFLWQTPPPEPVYQHPVMRDFYRWELRQFRENRTFSGFVRRGAEKFGEWWRFYVGPALSIPLLALPWTVGDRKMRLPFVMCGLLLAGFAVQTWTLPHYFSPATGMLYLILLQCMRHLSLWRRDGRLVGVAAVRAIPLICCAMILLRVTAVVAHAQIEPDWPRGNLDRVAILGQLDSLPGRHLVIVRYGQNHDVDWEWVWNDADIDAAKVVWARDMSEDQNRELLQYFANRQVWMVAADEPHPKLEPYLPALKTSLP